MFCNANSVAHFEWQLCSCKAEKVCEKCLVGIFKNLYHIRSSPREVHHNKSLSGSLSFHRPSRTHGKLRAKCACTFGGEGDGCAPRGHVNCPIVLTTGPVWNETGDIGSAITAERADNAHCSIPACVPSAEWVSTPGEPYMNKTVWHACEIIYNSAHNGGIMPGGEDLGALKS
jgi:hypothetical protein